MVIARRLPCPCGAWLEPRPGVLSAGQQPELLPQAARPRTRAAAWVSYKVGLHRGRPPPCRPRTTCTRATGSSRPQSRRTASVRHLVAEQLVDRPSEEEVELENERMAAPGAWKADAHTSGATSPPPSSWVCHAGSGELIKTGCGNPIWSLICCRRRSDRSIQFTLCLQPYASELYFSNSLP